MPDTEAIRAAYFVVQDAQAAEDIVQVALLAVYHHCQSFDERRPFEPYLMRTVMNAAQNYAQRRARRGLGCGRRTHPQSR